MIDTTLDRIVEAMATAVFIVVFRLGDSVIDVDGGYFELPFPASLAGDAHPWWFLR